MQIRTVWPRSLLFTSTIHEPRNTFTLTNTLIIVFALNTLLVDTQRWKTSIQRWFNVCRINIESTLFQRCVPAGSSPRLQVNTQLFGTVALLWCVFSRLEFHTIIILEFKQVCSTICWCDGWMTNKWWSLSDILLWHLIWVYTVW